MNLRIVREILSYRPNYYIYTCSEYAVRIEPNLEAMCVFTTCTILEMC